MSTITIISGTLDSKSGSYRAANTDTWASLGSSPYATWANWNTWTTSSANLQLRIDDDLGSKALRAPTIEFPDLVGTIASASLKISETGVFGGEETTYTLTASTDTNVIAGQYYRWTFSFAGTALLPAEVCEITVNYLEELDTEYYQSIHTSTLQTSGAYRLVPTGLTSVDHVQITAHDDFAWVDRAYALPDAWSETYITPIPGIISKSPLVICLRDHFGVEVDGTIDILIRGQRPITLTTQGVVVT